MLIKFVATKGMPEWHGYGGIWRNGHTKEVPDFIGRRLLSLHQSPFVEVGEKQASPASDKMVHGAPQNKSVEDLKSEGLEKQPKFRSKFGKKKR